MELKLNDIEKIPIIEIVFGEFIKVNKKSKNFNTLEITSDRLFEKNYKKADSNIEYPVIFEKSPVIDKLSSFFLDKIFSNNDLILYFQKNINVYFNQLVSRYIEYINHTVIGDVEDSDSEVDKLKSLSLTPLTKTDIMFVWKGSTAMKTIYKKYSTVLHREISAKIEEKYGDKYFSKKSDADCAIFINPNNKDADFHRRNMIILSFLMLKWFRNAIDKNMINSILDKIDFKIDYDDIRKQTTHDDMDNDSDNKKDTEIEKGKNIKIQKWSFTKMPRYDRILIKEDGSSNYISHYLNNEDYKNSAGENINYYKNEMNNFYLSIHDRTLNNVTKCDNFYKNFSLIKMKCDIICKLDVTFEDNTTRTIHYLLSNDVIDMAIRTIDDASLSKDYEYINSIVMSYSKTGLVSKKNFTFTSYTLDGFIMDFIYNLFKTHDKYKGCIPAYVPKYESNLNRMFYFILLKLLFIKSNDEKLCTKLIDGLIFNIRNIRYGTLDKIIKLDDIIFDYLMDNIIKLQSLYPANSLESKYKFLNELLEQLYFIRDDVIKKYANIPKLVATQATVLEMNKYLKYKTKYLELKKLIGGKFIPIFPNFSLYIKSDINDSRLLEFLKARTLSLIKSGCCYVPNHTNHDDYKYHISLVRLYINTHHPNYKITNGNWTRVQNLIKEAGDNLMKQQQIQISRLDVIGQDKSFIAVYFNSDINTTNYNNFIKDIVNIFSDDNVQIDIQKNDKMIYVLINKMVIACFEDYYYNPCHISVVQSDSSKDDLMNNSLLEKQYSVIEMCKYVSDKYKMDKNTTVVSIKHDANFIKIKSRPKPSDIINKNNY